MIKLHNRFKHLFFALAIFGPTLFLNTPTLTVPEADKEIVFLWDIHDVLLHQTKKSFLLNPFYWPSTIVKLVKSGIKFSRKQKNMVKKAIRQEGCTTDLIDIAQKEGNTALANLIIEIGNSVKPVKGMEQLVTSLTNNGYRQFIGSNISSQAFEKLKPRYKKLFANFKGIAQVCNVNSRHADGRIITKPDLAFYEEFLKNNHIDLTKTRVIFIDDKAKNVARARAAGLEGIAFKNVTQLKAALIEKGIYLGTNGRVAQHPA